MHEVKKSILLAIILVAILGSIGAVNTVMAYRAPTGPPHTTPPTSPPPGYVPAKNIPQNVGTASLAPAGLGYFWPILIVVIILVAANGIYYFLRKKKKRIQ